MPDKISDLFLCPQLVVVTDLAKTVNLDVLLRGMHAEVGQSVCLIRMDAPATRDSMAWTAHRVSVKALCLYL